MKLKNLFQAGRIGSATIKNRLVMPSLLTGLANPDGTVSEGLIAFYETRAWGGAGLIITEATRVVEHGRHNNWQLGAFDDRQIDGLTQLTERRPAARRPSSASTATTCIARPTF